MVAPFLGGRDPLFGARFMVPAMAKFFDPGRLALLDPDEAADLSILYGCGAALAGWDGSLVHLGRPRTESSTARAIGEESLPTWAQDDGCEDLLQTSPISSIGRR
ncbi:hypothetical protein HS125_11645 [bacterium]|nr:hypothetical protein [bacterium]